MECMPRPLQHTVEPDRPRIVVRKLAPQGPDLVLQHPDHLVGRVHGVNRVPDLAAHGGVT